MVALKVASVLLGMKNPISGEQFPVIFDKIEEVAQLPKGQLGQLLIGLVTEPCNHGLE